MLIKLEIMNKAVLKKSTTGNLSIKRSLEKIRKRNETMKMRYLGTVLTQNKMYHDAKNRKTEKNKIKKQKTKNKKREYISIVPP